MTPRPQPGNPRPRLFRLATDRALINRFGFNSDGRGAAWRGIWPQRSDPLAGRMRARHQRRQEQGHAQRAGRGRLRPRHRRCSTRFADYFVVNVSSPNTAGLRDLQEGRTLRTLVEQVVGPRATSDSPAAPIPVLVKVSPDVDRDRTAALGRRGARRRRGWRHRHEHDRRTAGLTTPPSLAAEAGRPERRAAATTAANECCRQLFRHLGGASRSSASAASSRPTMPTSASGRARRSSRSTRR